jgi:hypothetical protein
VHSPAGEITMGLVGGGMVVGSWVGVVMVGS